MQLYGQISLQIHKQNFIFQLSFVLSSTKSLIFLIKDLLCRYSFQAQPGLHAALLAAASAAPGTVQQSLLVLLFSQAINLAQVLLIAHTVQKLPKILGLKPVIDLIYVKRQ